MGMQICLKILGDELKGVGKGKGMDWLQVMLLIEAYEEVLEGCRKELVRPQLTGDNGRRRRVKEGERVVDLWLDSLYGAYEEELGG